MVVAMVIVIISVIGGLATVRLKASSYSQLSDYNCTEWSVKNEAAYAPIMAMIKIKNKEKGGDRVMFLLVQSRNGPNSSNTPL